ncbi:MAG: undecaprenyl-diphosphate phosphatase [Planctomycetaceae bacterium]|nr:undecaprenyl-diphosphate phosphatase [Planctomycetaceae bacterium]
MDSEVVRAIILGVVQGIAEFLPISSSGHLVIADKLMEEFSGHGFGEAGLSLNVALHVGSLFSILAVFWRDILGLWNQWRVCGLIILATIPVGLIGVLFEDQINSAFTEPLFVGCALLLTAVLLLVGQKMESGSVVVPELPWLKALIIGLFQAVAIIPGVSRSGSTIAGGMLVGLERSAAARFSFLLAIPPIGGAGLLKFLDLRDQPDIGISVTALIAGMVTSFVVGYLSLNWLLKLISQRQLHRFAAYCAIVAVATIAWRLPTVTQGNLQSESNQTPSATVPSPGEDSEIFVLQPEPFFYSTDEVRRF